MFGIREALHGVCACVRACVCMCDCITYPGEVSVSTVHPPTQPCIRHSNEVEGFLLISFVA